MKCLNIKILLLLVIPFAMSGQRFISGQITDADENMPLPGASVFISNTTIGSTSDAKGYYKLRLPGEGSYQLTVSYVGYQPVFKDIEPGDTSIIFNVALKNQELDEVTVTRKIKFRQIDINLFWNTLLGKRPSKKTLYVTNPETVFYHYNPTSMILKVTCREPLEIINNETGYKIQMVVGHFTHDYKNDVSSWETSTIFKELKPVDDRQKTTWEKNRQRIYQYSLANFIKSLYNNSLKENGFLLTYIGKGNVMGVREKDVYENPDFFIKTDSLRRSKTFFIPPLITDLMLVCFGNPVTERILDKVDLAQKGDTGWDQLGIYRNVLFTPQVPVRIFPDGTYQSALQLYPVFFSKSLLGLDMTLPVEYVPVAGSETLASGFDTDVPIEELIANRFKEQLKVFPQEKIWLHTDKPYYLSGEKIWFRAYLADASTHIPSPYSQYVYVELFNPLDSVVARVKIRREDDVFHGYLPVPEDLPEGDYTLRAYTTLMLNCDEHYFFHKTVHIGGPDSRIVPAETDVASTSGQLDPVPEPDDDFEVTAYPDSGYSLAVTSGSDSIHVAVRKIRDGELYLLAHTRGMIHFVDLWDHDKPLVSFQKELFPSGVLQFVLFDAGTNPVSERLVFINNPDQSQVVFLTDKENYDVRSPVKSLVTLTDADGRPLAGSFSVAVTSDREVTPDYTSNILAHLLLASDLPVTIENPTAYLQHTPEALRASDWLMRQQVWRRYPIPDLLKGRFLRPQTPIEPGSEIAGTVTNYLTGRPLKDIEVSAVSLDNNFFEVITTDKDGRFRFTGGDWADSAQVVVSAKPNKRLTQMNMVLDELTFPGKTAPALPPVAIDKAQFAQYAVKAEQQYTWEHGKRMIDLPEVSVTAVQQTQAVKSEYYDNSAARTLKEKEVENWLGTNVLKVLESLPEVNLHEQNGEVTITVGFGIMHDNALILVDNAIVSTNDIKDYLENIPIEDVYQIDVLKAGPETAIFGIQGASGVIAIFTKTVNKPVYTKKTPLFHIRTLFPLGYQRPVVFLAPKYDTPEKRKSQLPDLRTTIHWLPVVQVDNKGNASFEFYTADETTSYTVIIEGLTLDGRIIRKEEKIFVKIEKRLIEANQK